MNERLLCFSSVQIFGIINERSILREDFKNDFRMERAGTHFIFY